MRNFAEVRADLMDVKSAAFAQIATAELATTKKQKAMVTAGVGGAAVLGTVGCTMAATNTIFDIFTDTLAGWVPNIIALGSVIAAIAFAIALIMMIFSSDPGSASRAKGWMVRIIIGWVALMALTTIVTLINNATKDYKWDQTGSNFKSAAGVTGN